MSDNPFKSPNSLSADFGQKFDSRGGQRHDGSGRGYVRQVSVVSILMIVQGLLLLLFAICCVGYAYFFANIEAFIPAEQQGGFNAMPPQQKMMMVWMFAGWGGLSLLLAIVQIATGALNFGFRGRMMGITTLLLGIASALTCYCAFTGIPLTIYGLIIYFNPAVAEAFRLRKSGLSKQEVLAQFVR